MIRLRNAIFGIFAEILSRNIFSSDKVITRRTRDHGAPCSTDAIPPTGGLRIYATGDLILVDADRSGGIVRLVHCWQFLARNRGEGTPHISLFYVFLSPSPRARETYRVLWDFMRVKVQEDLGDRLQAHFAVIERLLPLDLRGGIPGTIIEDCRAQLQDQCILGIFAQLLSGKPGPRNGPPSFSPRGATPPGNSLVKSIAGVPRQ